MQGEREKDSRKRALFPDSPVCWDGGSVSCLVLALQCRLKIAPLGGVSRERMGRDNEQHKPANAA